MKRDDEPDGRCDPADAARRCGMGLLVAAGVMAAAGLTACKTAPPPQTRVEGDIQCAANLNPSVTQRPSPLRLRVYELRSPTAFNQADFMALYQSDQATLGPDLVAREEFVLQPGESRPYAKVLAPETRFIGVVAVYRDLERATWRVAVAVQAGRTQRLAIRAESLAVSAAVQP